MWAGHADLTDEATVTRLVRLGRRAPGEAGAVLDAARALRANLYACLTAPEDVRAFSVVARFAEAASKVSVFARDEDTGLGRWTLSPTAGLRIPVHAAALSAAALLMDPRRANVCACRYEKCGWLFLDPSGRRRYCSVATCRSGAAVSGDGAELRRALLAVVRERGGARDEAVARALLTVPRHLFVPEVGLAEAYRDDAIITKRNADGVPVSSSSQPTIMALMLDQLGLAPGHRVLEIGAGTGYNAALLAELVGPAGEVVSLDIAPDVVERARKSLSTAGYGRVDVVCADGAHGHAERAPYDRIIATVGVWDLAPAWLDQLAPGGRIVVPLDLHGAQVSVALERDGGGWVSRSLVPCGFMQLRGELAGPVQTVVVHRDPGVVVLMVPDDREVDAEVVRAALAGPADTVPTGVRLGVDEIGGLRTWLAIVEPRSCGLSGDGDGDGDDDGDDGGEADTMAAAAGNRCWPRPSCSGPASAPRRESSPPPARARAPIGASIALLGRRSVGDELVEVYASGYGPDGDRLANDLAGRVRDWEAAGRPGPARLGITAYPRDTRPGRRHHHCQGPHPDRRLRTAVTDLLWTVTAAGPG